MKNQDIQAKIDVSTELLVEARTFYESSNYDKSERCAKEVLERLESFAERDDLGEERDTSSQKYAVIDLLAHAYNRLNTISTARADYALSLRQAEIGLSFSERMGNFARKAILLGNIGNVYQSLSDYPKAMEYLQKALAINEELSRRSGIANNLGNIGNVYGSLSDSPNALVYYQKALAIYEELGSNSGIAKNLGNIGLVYWNLSDYPNALEYFQKALALNVELGSKSSIANNLGNIGLVYQNLSDYPKALEYYHKALAIDVELGSKSGIASELGDIGIVYRNLSDYPKALEYLQKALAINEELGSKHSIASNLGNIGNVYGDFSDHLKALEYYQKALAINEELGIKSGIASNLGNIGATYAKPEFDGYDPTQADKFLQKALALCMEIGAKHLLYEFHKILADLYENEKRDTEALLHFKKYHDLEKEVQSEEAKKQAGLMEQRHQAAEREKQLEIERTRATAEKRILDNILPTEITTRLIQGENPIADHFDAVSVLFMDIVDFTPLASSITAQQLVHLLNAIFSSADGVMREFGMEKIKTIGDAYMAVAGAPTPCEDHAQRAAQAALKLLDVMQNLVVTFPEGYGDRSWIAAIPEIHVRIGLHCGAAAAGVVGENKFLYDLWGDAVNTASRMESHGEAGKIHVSEEFMHALSLSSPMSLHFQERGEMAIKGKGMMKTYFLER